MSEVFSYVKSPLEELRDLLPGSGGFDFGASPHGLSAGLPLPVQETLEASSLSLHAKPLLTFSEPSTSPARPQGAYGREMGFKRSMPNVYTSAKANCRSLQQAACAAQPPYYLRLGDREFLQVYSAVEHDRNRTRKAIGKGLCEVGDLRASDPLWQILQDVMTRRMKGYRL